jgi:hypothetical protein
MGIGGDLLFGVWTAWRMRDHVMGEGQSGILCGFGVEVEVVREELGRICN